MSSHIRVRKHKAKQLASLVTLAFPAAAFAQQAVTLPEVKVESKADVPYKVDVSANPKYTQPLVDTPQTISIVPKETFLQQGASTLMEALRNTPGLTSQIGENGALAAGDTFSMRGVANSQSSIFLDGVRDIGAVTRDIYNVEQVEIVKGPAGADIGRGAGAGYINMISKLPTLQNSTSGEVSINTGNLKRGTVDYNSKMDDTSAFRLNAMVQDGGVDGRDYVSNSGWAFAPGVAFGLGTDTRVQVYANILQQDNVPDGGISAIGNPGYQRPASASTPALSGAAATANFTGAPRVDRNNYYGSVNDYEKVKSAQLTAKIEHDLADGGIFRNVTRVGRSSNERISHSPFLVYPNATGSATALNTNPATWTISTSNQGLDQTNEILVNQTSLNKTYTTGSVKHDVMFGLELMQESQRNNTLGFVTTPPLVYNSLYNPNPNLAMYVPTETGAYTDGKTQTAAIYGSDTIKLSPAWQLTGALRLERYKTTTDALTTVTTNNQASYPGYGLGALAPSSLSNKDTLTSWKLAALYKPASNGSIYAAVANSQTPPGSGSFALNIAANNASSPFMKPQEFLNKEVGTKWDFLDRALGLAIAYYETGIKNETPQQQADGTYAASGDRTVSGIEASLVGAITSKWSISAGIATMDTKVKQGVAGDTTVVAGASARYSPELTATLWTTYTEGPWTVGGGARYVSEQIRVVDPTTDLSQRSMPTLPSYSVFDAMASYQVSKNVTVRLNMYNLADKYYITGTNGNSQLNSGGRIVLGAPRSGMLSVALQF